MTKTISDLFPGQEIEGPYNFPVQFISQELTDYSDGDVTMTYIFELDGKYYQFEYLSNSWEEYYGEDFGDLELTEVAPVQVMVTQYHPVT